MRDQTRKLFNILCGRIAAGYGVADVSQQFSVSPSVQQLLKDKIVEASTFLPRINIITVDELKGENILAGASGPVTGRTDTTGNAERTPRDVYMRYYTVDAWAKFRDLAERFLRYVQARIASDNQDDILQYFKMLTENSNSNTGNREKKWNRVPSLLQASGAPVLKDLLQPKRGKGMGASRKSGPKSAASYATEFDVFPC